MMCYICYQPKCIVLFISNDIFREMTWSSHDNVRDISYSHSATKRIEQRSPGSFVLSIVVEEGGSGEWETWERWSRERGREDSLRRPQLKRGPATERVQLPTGNGIPLFPGTMIRYVAVWITHNITPAGLVRGGCIRRESVEGVGSGWVRTPRNMKFKNPQIEGGCMPYSLERRRESRAVCELPLAAIVDGAMQIAPVKPTIGVEIRLELKCFTINFPNWRSRFKIIL